MDQDERFARIALEHGLMTQKQLDQCRQTQRVTGKGKSLVAIALERKFVTRRQLQELQKAIRATPRKKIDGFELLQRLGSGAMGTVYRARQTVMDRIVALKVLHEHLGENEGFLKQFYEEAKVAARLDHPNIVRGINAGEADGYHYFAMEYVEGQTLHRILTRQGILPVEQALRIGLGVARALEHAASVGIVHRDVKPGNIMITEDGVPKLCDLGLAKRLDRTSLKPAGPVGTPYYLSPEQARGESNVDTRSDIYSLGATLFRAITGRVPFQGGSAQEIIRKHIEEQLPWPPAINPDVPEDVAVIICKMMAKTPRERYQSPGEVAEDIQRVLEGKRPSCVELVVAFQDQIEKAQSETQQILAARLTERQGRLRVFATCAKAFQELERMSAGDGDSLLQELQEALGAEDAQTFVKVAALLLAASNAQRARDFVQRAESKGASLGQVKKRLDALAAPVGMTFVPDGEFIMGSEERPEEKPIRRVHLKAFYIDVYPVTNAQYKAFVDATGHRKPPSWINGTYPNGKDDFPVTHVSWYDAQAYARWAKKRLPTEAEWEKAARGEDARIWPWGNEFGKDRCASRESGVTGPVEVGRFATGASPYGCCEMAGNVWEWTNDWFLPYPGCSEWKPPEEKQRVLRGGSFRDGQSHVRCAMRIGEQPDAVRLDCGFRCALDA